MLSESTTLQVDCSPTSSVEDLKIALQRQTCLPPVLQTLLSSAGKLDDRKSLADNRVMEGDVILLHCKVASGIRVFVRTATVPYVVLNVNPIESIITFRELLQSKLGYSLQLCSLLLDCTLLEDNFTLAQYNIRPDCVIELVGPYFTVNVSSITGRTYSHDVLSTHTARNLITAVQANEGLFLTQQLTLSFNHVQLEDDQPLSDYGIQEGSTLELILNRSQGYQIFVKGLSGKTFTLDVVDSNTFHEIKGKIRTKDCIPVEHQLLIYRGKVLNDTSTLAEHSIGKCATLHLTMRLLSGPRLLINTAAGETITLDYNGTDTIAKVKMRIHEIAGIQPDRQVLSFEMTKLEDSKTLEDYKIKAEATLTLKLIKTVSLIVKTMDGRAILIKSDVSGTIEDIKQQLSMSEGFPYNKQRLIFKGKELDDAMTVCDIDLRNGMVLYLVIRLRKYLVLIVQSKSLGARCVTIEDRDSVSRVKSILAETTGVHATKQRLLKSDKVLEDSQKFSARENKRRVQLTLVECFSIEVPWKGNVIELSVTGEDTVKNVKQQIMSKTNIPIKDQILYLRGTELENMQTLDHYNISEGSRLELQKKQRHVLF
eukprot:CAMPEP_0204912408 /NCGR_PEP_ID=MMETSP1397-20131031/10568_1 /ASSEMBLY_ACC=CAM_ASM_000891 /TAXON_ID=49980 /ORGANISM="Climacostomum Climacostomum virens, Strain Stock W-24" /LENGTH=596 /DNA_ID=CAMNT_0052083351 /DNA_START=183 /DNA_END=1973 /DNA_ORIENTATION=-